MDVEGLRANGPGDKAKVFGMQEGQGDFITNDYRVDIQYRGTAGFPPNAIQWRVIYGDADDLDVRYEPDTAKRFESVFLLNPSTTYHWKFTWGSAIRLRMIENGVSGTTLYDFGMPATRRRLHAEPALRLPRCAARPQRQRVGVDPGHHLPQRLDWRASRVRRRSAARCCRSSRPGSRGTDGGMLAAILLAAGRDHLRRRPAAARRARLRRSISPSAPATSSAWHARPTPARPSRRRSRCRLPASCRLARTAVPASR